MSRNTTTVVSAIFCGLLLGTNVGYVGIVQGQPSTINATEVGRWNDYPGAYSDVCAEGNYAYVPNFALADGNTARIHILDISNPANPVLDNTFFVPAPNEFASPQDVKLGDGLLFVVLEGADGVGSFGDDSVVIVDVRDPTAPVQVATVRLPGPPPFENYTNFHNGFYEDGFLYLANSATPIVVIVDLTALDPDNPPAAPIGDIKWVLINVGTSKVHDITVRNGRLYAAAWDGGLWIYDVTDVANTEPTLLGSVGGNSTHSMWPTDDGKFVVTGEERSGGGIKVYEITDNGGSVTLTLRDSLVISPGVFSVHNQIVIGNRLYNSWYEAGLQVFDIDPNTGKLQFVASYDTSRCWGIYPYLGDDKILLTDIPDGFYVIEIGDSPATTPLPAAPPHDNRKNRFVSFDPNQWPISVAIRVELLDLVCGATGKKCTSSAECKACVGGTDDGSGCSADSDCPEGACELSGETCDEQSPPVMLGWVSDPIQAGGDALPGTLTSEVVAAQPAVRIWTESVVHIGDCEIAPVRTYGISATTDGVVFSNPLVIGTIEKPQGKFWGDVVGNFDGVVWSPPNGLVGVDDVNAVIKFLSLKPAPHITVVDLVGSSPTFVNTDVNASDLQQILKAFSEGVFPPIPLLVDGYPADGDLTQCP